MLAMKTVQVAQNRLIQIKKTNKYLCDYVWEDCLQCLPHSHDCGVRKETGKNIPKEGCT